jgi:glycosyltransferase involved in cell wall biosynthesis
VAQNIESTIWRRYAEVEANALRRWFFREQWRKYRRFEHWAYAEATRVVAVSDQDAAHLANDFGAEQVEVVENGVDTSYFRPPTGPRDLHEVLFLGSLDWRPNQDAVARLLDQVFPQVKAREPAAKLCVVGRCPPEWLRRRAAATPGVELHGDVPDVRPFLHRCGVLVVPLRIGGGSRLKILEALACATPVVSTKVGAEGLCLDHGKDLLVGSLDELPSLLLQCIRQPQQARARAERGRMRVLARYDWDRLADKLEAVWLRCVQHREP